MHLPENCAVVIPCRNEARCIGRVVAEVRQVLPKVAVVDDGSSDATAEMAAAAGAVVLGHPRSLGKGAALKRGFDWASANGFEWVIAMDGDGQHLPREIRTFLEAKESNHAALVIGRRDFRNGGMPWARRVVNRWMSKKLSVFCGQDLPDSQCGFRLLKLSAWQELTVKADHFEIESEMIVRFLAAGHKIAFVPVSTCYAGERSKIRPFRDSIKWLRWRAGIMKEFKEDISLAPGARNLAAGGAGQ